MTNNNQEYRHSTQPIIDFGREKALLTNLDNLKSLREKINPTQNEVHLHAAAVRSLLLDRLLPSCLGIRRMQLSFLVPDVKPLMRAASNKHLTMYHLAGLEVFGIQISGSYMSIGNFSNVNFDPSVLMSVNIDTFLKQCVAYSKGEFLTRYDIIYYVSNKAGGVHYDNKPNDKLSESKIHALGNLRRSVQLGIESGGVMMRYMNLVDEDQSDHFRYEPEFIDAVYLEFLACIGYIINSPNVQELQRIILQNIK